MGIGGVFILGHLTADSTNYAITIKKKRNVEVPQKVTSKRHLANTITLTCKV